MPNYNKFVMTNEEIEIAMVNGARALLLAQSTGNVANADARQMVGVGVGVGVDDGGVGVGVGGGCWCCCYCCN